MIPYLDESFWIGLLCLVTGEYSDCRWAVDDTPLDYTHSSYVAPTNKGTPNVEICITLVPDPLPIQWTSEGCESQYFVLCEGKHLSIFLFYDLIFKFEYIDQCKS